MLRILFLTHRFPFPPDRGDRIRAYQVLSHLAGRHRVSLGAVVEQRPSPDQFDVVRKICTTVDIGRLGPSRWAVAAGHLTTTVPLTVPLFACRALRARVGDRLAAERFDLIYIYTAAMAPYVLDDPRVPKVIDFVDADSQKWLDYAATATWPVRAIYRREGRLLRRLEQRIAAACAHGFVASEREAAVLRPIVPGLPITTIRNGVDVPAAVPTARRDDTLAFTGVMDYRPNVDAMRFFVREILPRIRIRVPAVRLVIVGQRPSREVRQLAQSAGITVTGWVPDVAEHLRTATAFVAPLRIARGVQNKVLEAMAAGLPVVGTPAALAGLEAVAGREVLIAEDPDRFAAETIAVLTDPRLRSRLGRAGREFVLRCHAWGPHLAQLEAILQDAARGGRAGLAMRTRTHVHQ